MNNKLFECSLGCHEYEIPHKNNPNILICKHCKRFGHYKNGAAGGWEFWIEYDKDGNEIHYKSNAEYEYWCKYDNNGNQIYYRNDGIKAEKWLHNGEWVYNVKPIDWEYENI